MSEVQVFGLVFVSRGRNSSGDWAGEDMGEEWAYQWEGGEVTLSHYVTGFWHARALLADGDLFRQAEAAPTPEGALENLLRRIERHTQGLMSRVQMLRRGTEHLRAAGGERRLWYDRLSDDLV